MPGGAGTASIKGCKFRMSPPCPSLVRLTRHASTAHPFTRAPVAKRFFISTPSQKASRNEASDSSSGVVNLGQRSAGFVAAKDEAGNPIGREPGPLYREWFASSGAHFKDPRPHETNYLGGSIVSRSLFVFGSHSCDIDPCFSLARPRLPTISLSHSTLHSDHPRLCLTVSATSFSANG